MPNHRRRSPQKHLIKKSQAKDVERLDISVEVEGTKPVNVTVEVNLLLAKTQRMDAEALVKEAIAQAHNATEIFLSKLK